MILRAFYYVPLLGWLARDAVEGASDAKYYFFLNVAILYAVLLYFVGYPLLIVTALAATGTVLTTIVILTATDLIDNTLRTRRKGDTARAQ